jgi:hypothetical protein
MVNYAPDFLRFKQPYDPFSPTPDALPIRSPLLSEARANAVPVVKNWSHPFKDNRNPLQQLTHLAKAVAGFYPLGASGLWHGGIHFDGGTAGMLDQSSVHCLADGEVVAYRIDRHSPTTMYWVNNITVNKPFSRNFVLVRHRLQLPKVESSEVEPPSLIFYSLYMHLQDWAVYEGDESIARPPFWSEGATRYVKQNVNDMHIRYPDQQGLNVRAHGPTGPILDLALRGSQVTVSGEGNFRKLENTSGPDYLKDAEGALRGYISADYLRPIADGQYRIHCATKLNIRAEPRSRDQFGKEVEVLGALPNGTEITVSGEGAFRKLEHINQYVHYPSLQGKQEPLAQDQVVVLDQPVPIKAGDLIGHIGLYQDQGAQQPERKLHLEVFSGDDVEVFIKNSRAWAQRLPGTSKTWLKIAKGTPVVAHQEHFSPQYPPTLSAASTPSDADLQIPKSLLDGLPAERKITVPAAWDRKTCNWYRLDGLLHDANNTLLKGWVCEEVGVTPWVSPWEWDGYDALFNFDPPRLMLASYLRIANRFDDVQLERFGPIADAGDKGPIKERLYDIIDRNRDDQITAAELRAALSLPAHAQSISQLIFHSESEWYHTPKKWDALDELLGHSGSTPNLNWLAEKERIKQLGWWSEVAGKVGLQESGKVYHFHPVGLMNNFFIKDKCACGCCLGIKFSRYRWVRQRRNNPDMTYYGPIYQGTKKLDKFTGWSVLIQKGQATEDEKAIVIAMSSNEGAMDAVQAWDWQTFSAGAMQKTVTPEGYGELPQQISEFAVENPDLFNELFIRCGWSIKKEVNGMRIYYASEETGAKEVTGNDLYDLIRKGFQKNDTGFPKESTPLASIAFAMINEEFQKKQVVDFIKRMRSALRKTPNGYSNPVSDFFQSRLGRALVLDHDVNAPANVTRSLKAAIDTLLGRFPDLSSNPLLWGSGRGQYEDELIMIYGPSRNMNSPSERYNHLKILL